ncbi:MAG: tRNA dihydrouridine(20/20a) synthase DusA [Woeseiaceae bacterium]|nr:tRNA dihydrouridine(20/20a) synthase DusA [Woeseiaceae bacterium]
MQSKISVAPMMDWTDRHCRYFMRLLSPSARLYTEMVTAQAIHHGDQQKILAFDPLEHPAALQLGGSDPELMAESAQAGASFGYDEININVGCPSDRVQSGQFGACLMAAPDVVAACVRSIRSSVSVPVTIKTRIGIDDRDDYSFLLDFIDATAEAGCDTYIVHARKAILQGLSPKENRSVPPLNYERVYQLKADRPKLTIVLNGGVTTVAECKAHLAQVDGVMVGRQAYHEPWFLTELESAFGGGSVPRDRYDVVAAMLPYVEHELADGALLKHITRHMLGLFAGLPGARAWRRYLSENAHRNGADSSVIMGALARLPEPGNLLASKESAAHSTGG